MTFTFGKFFLASAVLAAAALATTAMAETTVKVPFDFTVKGKTWPAGLYAVQMDSNRSRIMVTSKKTSNSFGWTTTTGVADPKSTNVVLKFDADGGSHALRSIQYGSVTTPRLDGDSTELEHLPAGSSHGR
jgi:hypothetical protein